MQAYPNPPKRERFKPRTMLKEEPDSNKIGTQAAGLVRGPFDQLENHGRT